MEIEPQQKKTPVKRKKKQRTTVGDNYIALSVVGVAGALCLVSLYPSVDPEVAKLTMGIGANTLSGVIGYIGGKNEDKEEV